jgi:hypothetical protein
MNDETEKLKAEILKLRTDFENRLQDLDTRWTITFNTLADRVKRLEQSMEKKRSP